MKYKIQLYVAGQLFDFFCYAQNLNEARRVALSQYPNARITHSTPTFL